MKPFIKIVTGLSGSGKTTVLHTLEDAGFYCVDNLPVLLIEQFLNLVERSEEKIDRVAMVVDVREKEFLKHFNKVVGNLRENGYQVQVIFLDTRDDVIIKRFKETRRRHPLFPIPISDAIKREREILHPLRENSDEIINTSDFTPSNLRTFIMSRILKGIECPKVLIFSFGYKYGIPSEADMVFDVRFLPNPYFVDTLKEESGLSDGVQKFVLQHGETSYFLTVLFDFVDKVLSLYRKEGRAQVSIAVGCTGGRHRSVVVAEELTNYLKKRKFIVNTIHRDIEKEG